MTLATRIRSKGARRFNARGAALLKPFDGAGPDHIPEYPARLSQCRRQPRGRHALIRRGERLCPDFLSAGFDLCGILVLCALVPALRICGRCRRLVVAAFAAGLAIEGRPQFIGTSRSSHCFARFRSFHFAPRFLICLKFRMAGSPSRRIFARLRSLAGNIIALTTAERSFIVP